MSACMRILTFVAFVVVSGPLPPAEAKTPGQTYCHNTICHRVRTLDETVDAIGRVDRVLASHYDAPARDRFNPRLATSSGVRFDPEAPDNAASPIWPDGTIVLVRALDSGHAAIVRINNAGPYRGKRMIDLSRALAERLGIATAGVAQVETVVIAAPNEGDARHQTGRAYPPVAGPIGSFSTIDAALGALDLDRPWVAVSPTPKLTALRGDARPVGVVKPRVRLALAPRDRSRGEIEDAALGQTPWARSFSTGGTGSH
jgi:hypothetical protein